MSQIHYEDVPIGEILPHARAIVVARPLGADSLSLRFSGPDGHEDFSLPVRRFEVSSALRGNLAPGSKIDVVDPQDLRMFGLVKAYVETGVSKSPIFQVYASTLEGSFDPDRDEQILYLQDPAAPPESMPPEWRDRLGACHRLVVSNAGDSAVHVEAVRRLLT